MINNCVLQKQHYYCTECGSYFRNLLGDCIVSFHDLKAKCPYCGNDKIVPVEENAFRESLDFLRYKLGKIFR